MLLKHLNKEISKLIPYGEKFAIAFSGGGDSTALVHALKDHPQSEFVYIVDHNLDENYPIVQCWNTSTNQQELPTSVTTNSANRVTVVFSINFGGVIIVKK